ncbi:MAG: hypothetical protein GX166_04860 [Clostridiaceae bacterium]|nr:hypothetical protein [Clostridiaceae bacterium]
MIEVKSNYEVLGLPEDASLEDVERKYGALIRQYKRRVDEKGQTYEDLEYYRTITKAYNEITGKNYNLEDENPTSIIPYSVRRRFEIIQAHLSQYYFAIFAAVLLLAMGTLFFLQYKDNLKTDFGIKFVGAFTVDNPTKFNEEIVNRSNVIKNPVISFFTVTTETQLTPAVQSQATAFLSQLMVGKNLDVILIDKESYDAYVRQGAFLALDDILIEFSDREWYDSLVLYDYKKNPDVEEGKQPEEAVYGVDVTNTSFFEGTSLEWLHDVEKGQEKVMILTIARTSKNKEKAIDFMIEILDTMKLEQDG